MKPESAPSTSTEDYLERIHELIEQKGYARAVDIAVALGISQPSVTAMVQRLAQGGYLNYEKYRGLTLTEKGKLVAGAIRERHKTLERFFTLLNLPTETQEQDIEGLESEPGHGKRAGSFDGVFRDKPAGAAPVFRLRAEDLEPPTALASRRTWSALLRRTRLVTIGFFQGFWASAWYRCLA